MAVLSFKRIEKKFYITLEQMNELKKILLQHMSLDKYCQNDRTYLIQNIYYDSSSNSLIRRSIEKPCYKQKLRIRKYVGSDTYFLEIKKKYEGVVGKRRIQMNEKEFNEFFKNKKLPSEGKKQIINEIKYFLSLDEYTPHVLISYERLAFFDKEDKSFRVTFDTNLVSKKNNFDFNSLDYEEKIIDDNHCILEIKSTKNYPLWLTSALSSLKIYSNSFSKYGTDYMNRLKEKEF